METSVSIKRNMVMNIILTGSNFLFPLVTFSYVSRILGPEGIGKVAFAMSMLSYFSWIASLGIATYGVRECAKVRNNKEALSKCVQEIFFLNLFSTIVAYIVLFAAIILVPEMRKESMLYLVLSTLMLLNTIGMEWVYQALEQYKFITIRSVVFKSISVVLIFALIRSPQDYIMYGALNIFAIAASNIINFMYLRKFISLFPIKSKEYRKHLKPIFILLTSTISITIYANFDQVILGFMKGDSAVGMYNAALKIKNIVLSTSTAITAVIIPRMANYYQNGEIDKFRNVGLKSFRVSTIIAFPLATYILINAPDVLSFISGSQYSSAILTLRILMLCTYTLIITNLIGTQFLIPIGLESHFTKSVLIGMFINLLLNILLIPKFASEGSAIAILATELFNIYWMSRAIREEKNFIIRNYRPLPYLTGILISITIMMAIKSLTLNYILFVRLIMTSISFFLSYYAILLIMKEEIVSDVYLRIRNRVKL